MDHKQSIVIAPVEAAPNIARTNTTPGSPQIRMGNSSIGFLAMLRRICFEGQDVG